MSSVLRPRFPWGEESSQGSQERRTYDVGDVVDLEVRKGHASHGRSGEKLLNLHADGACGVGCVDRMFQKEVAKQLMRCSILSVHFGPFLYLFDPKGGSEHASYLH